MTISASPMRPAANGGALKLELPEGVEIKGNALVTRSGKFANLIFDSSCEDDLTTALLDLDIGKVSNGSTYLVRKLKEVNCIRKLFRSGLQWTDVPLKAAGNTEVLKDGEPPPEKDDKNSSSILAYRCSDDVFGLVDLCSLVHR